MLLKAKEMADIFSKAIKQRFNFVLLYEKQVAGKLT